METALDWIWLLLFYAVGTIIGFLWGLKRGALISIEQVVDSLIAQGYLKQRKNTLGQIELLKPTAFEE